MVEILSISAALLVLMASGFFLLLFFLRNVRIRDIPPGQSQGDVTGLMILFQTMRDISTQQKDLAREFNASFDKKVGEVRELVKAAKEESHELRGTQREIAAMIEETKTDLARFRQGFREDIEGLPTDAPEANRSGEFVDVKAAGSGIPRRPVEEAAEEELPLNTPPSSDGAPALDATPSSHAARSLDAAEEGAEGDSADLIDSWTGLDFGGDAPSALTFEVPAAVPESADEPETSRDAFRALLDLDAPLPPAGAAAKAAAGKSTTEGNGKNDQSRVRHRVCEYNDAGMSVAEISRELGLGKGEIRLILSLRDVKGG